MDELDPRYGLGLAQNVNRLVAYNPLWPQAYTEEAARIRPAFGDLALAVEHQGSTAVPGLSAKPIIDIQVGVAHIDEGLRFIEPLAGLGYDYAGDQGIPEHHIFGRGVVRTHLVHIAVFESEAWFRTLRFRDRLRADPELRATYQALKLDLAAGAVTRAEYTAGKTAFIERVSAPG